MKIKERRRLIARGRFPGSSAWLDLERDLVTAILAVQNPPGSGGFTIFAERGKDRGKGNGVKPIKEACIAHLVRQGWLKERRIQTANFSGHGAFDAVWIGPDASFRLSGKTGLALERGRAFAVEWETGNISSSHRALNKMALGIHQGVLRGGALIVPTRRLYAFLTDRVGNYEELAPYFPMWASMRPSDGLLEVIAIEHDAESLDRKLKIRKGTDGRALQ